LGTILEMVLSMYGSETRMGRGVSMALTNIEIKSKKPSYVSFFILK
jgi:hypothetical protein